MKFSNSNYLTILVIFLFITLQLGTSCFITNCPPGGKRSIPDEPAKPRECASCGPTGQGGRCFGPETCCSPEFGCLVGTPETYTCLLENRVSAVCHNPGTPCTGNSESGSFDGICAAEGVCCSPEICEADDSCHFEIKIPQTSSFHAVDSGSPVLASPSISGVPEPPPIEVIQRYKLAFQRDRFKKKRSFKSATPPESNY